MTNRCFIGILEKNNNVKYSFCMYDGNIELAGRILLQNYNYDKLCELLNIGKDIRFLSNRIDLCNFFEYEHNYNHDVKMNLETFKNIVFDDHYCDIKYIYLFKDGKYYFADRNNHKNLLENALEDFIC